MITPAELRQYDYCARVVFYDRVTPVRRRETRRMQYGRESHDKEHALERERSLQRYGLHEGTRAFNVSLTNLELELTGIADLIVTVGEEAYPVEFKDSTRPPNAGHAMQVCAYGLLIEAVHGLRSPRGFWHSTRTRETHVIEFDARLRRRTLKVIREINDFIRAERCPPPAAQVEKCLECELRNFCGDVF